MIVEEMLSRMSSREFMEWQAFWAVKAEEREKASRKR